MHYRKEIDGLRALAVLPVIFFHTGLRVLVAVMLVWIYFLLLVSI